MKKGYVRKAKLDDAIELAPKMRPADVLEVNGETEIDNETKKEYWTAYHSEESTPLLRAPSALKVSSTTSICQNSSIKGLAICILFVEIELR